MNLKSQWTAFHPQFRQGPAPETGWQVLDADNNVLADNLHRDVAILISIDHSLAMEAKQ